MPSNPTASGTTAAKSAGQSTRLSLPFDLDDDTVAYEIKRREIGGGKNITPPTENLLLRQHSEEPTQSMGLRWQGFASTIGFDAISSRNSFRPSGPPIGKRDEQ